MSGFTKLPTIAPPPHVTAGVKRKDPSTPLQSYHAPKKKAKQGTRSKKDIEPEIKAIAAAAAAAKWEQLKFQPLPLVTLDDLEPVLKHPGTVGLAKQLRVKARDIHDFLFLEEAPYDSVCIKDAGGEGTYYTRDQMHLMLWTYVLHRTSAIMLLESEGYIIGGQTLAKDPPTTKYTSATDTAFLAFFRSLIMDLDTVDQITCYIGGHGRTAVIDDEKSIKALKVWMEQPMTWTLQRKVGQILGVEEIVRVWFEDVAGPDGQAPAGSPGGGWQDIVWETMSKTYAGCVCPDERYEF